MMTAGGTPAQSYWTLRQMRKLGIGYGEVKTVKMSHIQNIETILQIEKAKREGITIDSALLESTASVSYAKTPLLQSGGRIVRESIKKTGGSTIRLGDLMRHY